MKRNRILATVALAGLLAAGSGALYAFDRPCGDGPGGFSGAGGHSGYGFGPVGAAYQLKDLTDDQRKQLDALRDQQRKSFEKNRSEHQALREQIRNTTDPKALRPLADKEGKYVADMIMQQAEMRAEVEKILTPEQRAQLKKEFEERRDNRRDRRKGGDGGW